MWSAEKAIVGSFFCQSLQNTNAAQSFRISQAEYFLNLWIVNFRIFNNWFTLSIKRRFRSNASPSAIFPTIQFADLREIARCLSRVQQYFNLFAAWLIVVSIVGNCRSIEFIHIFDLGYRDILFEDIPRVVVSVQSLFNILEDRFVNCFESIFNRLS